MVGGRSGGLSIPMSTTSASPSASMTRRANASETWIRRVAQPRSARVCS
jgi:hypothetical protein